MTTLCELPQKKRTARGQSRDRKPISISLFSGGGGLDIGMEQAGFETIACIEIDPNCCETLESNKMRYFKRARIINADVDEVDVDELMRELDIVPGDLDVLFGGPPCQTFSQIGKLGGLRDLRGRLLFSMVRYAEKLRPKAIIIENVKALQNAPDLDGVKGGVVRNLISRLELMGYTCNQQVINSADFGVPQLRKRLFIVATHDGSAFEFPAPECGTDSYKTIREALKGLPAPSGKEMAPEFANHVDVTPAGDRKRISYVSEGSFLAKMHSAPIEIRGRLSPKDTTKFLRLGWGKQSNTLRCGEIFFHPVDDRYLTPREYMRVHGFPDGYELRGPIRGRSGSVRFLDQHRQVANSVPPPVARAIGEQLIRKLFAFD
jgi:DNA (cytosine-5)-methyltransferase 1